jgi:hypothetical protein
MSGGCTVPCVAILPIPYQIKKKRPSVLVDTLLPRHARNHNRRHLRGR